MIRHELIVNLEQFQSSFELTGYITFILNEVRRLSRVSKLFRAYGLYNQASSDDSVILVMVSKLFRAYGLYNSLR